MNRHEIDPRATDASGSDNFQQTIALELALGCSLPNDIDAWPTGLLSAWNDAARSGAMADAKTLGDMARAFIRHRLDNLTHK